MGRIGNCCSGQHAEDCANYSGPTIAELDNTLAVLEQFERSLRNVRAFAVRALRKGTMTQDDCKTLLRFCSEAGVEASILRGD